MSNAEPVKVLLVEDHPVVREGVRLVLEGQPDLRVVGDAADGVTALELTRTLKPQVVVMDVHLGAESGIVTARQILAEFPDIRIVGLSADASLPVIHEVLQAGFSAYVVKTSASEELIRAIRATLERRLYLCPEVASRVVGDYLSNVAAPPAPSPTVLTERERTLLRLVAEGKRNKEIAETLGVGAKSVETYRYRLMRKLGCRSTNEMLRYALREGIATL